MLFLLILDIGNKAYLAIRHEINWSLEKRYCWVPLYTTLTAKRGRTDEPVISRQGASNVQRFPCPALQYLLVFVSAFDGSRAGALVGDRFL